MSTNINGNFKSGQLWKYKCRAGEERSKLLILFVETINEQNIVHVTIAGGCADNPMHMPFSEEAIRDSVMGLCKDGCPIPDYDEGYLYWKQQYDKGEAGVYKIPVAEALDL